MSKLNEYLEMAKKAPENLKDDEALMNGFSNSVNRSKGSLGYGPQDAANWLKTQGATEIKIYKKGYITLDDITEEIVILSFKYKNVQYYAACNDEFGLFEVDTKPMKPSDYK